MKIKNKIIAKNIYLRSLSLTDISLTYLRWLQDKDVNYFLETRHEKQTLSKIKGQCPFQQPLLKLEVHN